MKIRKSMKGPFIRGLLLLIMLILLFGGYGLSQLATRFFGSPDGIGLINGKSLSTSLFRHFVYEEDQKISAIRQRYRDKADLYMKLMNISQDTQATALKKLVAETLIHQYADARHIALADQYVREKISNPHFIMREAGHILPASLFNEEGKINVYALNQFIMQPELEGLRLQLADELKNEFVLALMLSAHYLPTFILRDLYFKTDVAKKFSVQTFSLDHFKKEIDKNKPTKEQLRAFYEQKSQQEGKYWIPEQRYGLVWEFDAEHYGISVSDSDIEEYYKKNKTTRYKDKPAEFKVREIVFNEAEKFGIEGLKKQAEAAYQKVIAQPDTFADVAKELSQSQETASHGGLVDYFVRGIKDAAYEKAVIHLKNDGDISPVTKVGNSFVIVQRLGRKEATYKSLHEVRNSIKNALIDQGFRKAFAQEADRVVKNGNQEEIDAFMKKHDAVSKNVGPVEKDLNQPYQRLFSIRNEHGYSVYVEHGHGFIVQLTKKEPRHLAAFSSISEKVQQDYEHEKAYNLMKDALKKAQVAAYEQGALVPVEGAHIETTKFIDPQDQDINSEYIIDRAYSEDFMHMTGRGEICVNLTDSKGTLVMLDELKKDEVEAFDLKKLDTMAAVSNMMNNVFKSACLASLFRNAKIKFNKEITQNKDSVL